MNEHGHLVSIAIFLFYLCDLRLFIEHAIICTLWNLEYSSKWYKEWHC